MSEIKVNKISPRTACGTTTLGDSGDTFTIPSGVTISNLGTAAGFGGTGEISWDTTVKTTGTFTATSGVGYFLNTGGGTITVNLPAGTAGSSVAMVDYAGTWQTSNVTVSPNGSEKIGGVAEDATLNIEGQSVTFVYIDGTQGWVNVLDSTSNVTGVPPYPQATVTGACNTLTVAPCCANYKIATFLNPGTFCVSSVSGTPANDTADYLVVAGGASGGIRSPGNGNAGGGAGGLRYSFATYTSPPSAPSHPIGSPTGKVLTVQGYPIVVGGGGAAIPALPSPTAARGNSGDTSSGLCISSAGGGGGGAGSNSPPTGPGGPGGSGGGGGGGSPSGIAAGTGNTPPTSPPQGKDGGVAGPTSPDAQSGGGGGAIACGGASTPSANGAGGAGAGFTGAFGTAAGQPCGSYRYFAGGGGSSDSPLPAPRQPGGVGGGGHGGQPGSSAASGTANTGGGGGGGTSTPPAPGGTSGGGGSGVVIIRYRFQ